MLQRGVYILRIINSFGIILKVEVGKPVLSSVHYSPLICSYVRKSSCGDEVLRGNGNGLPSVRSVSDFVLFFPLANCFLKLFIFLSSSTPLQRLNLHPNAADLWETLGW